MGKQDEELTDDRIQALWQEAWSEQNTSVEADPEELMALKSFLAKARPVLKQEGAREVIEWVEATFKQTTIGEERSVPNGTEIKFVFPDEWQTFKSTKIKGG